jgi:hypothetical protein
MKLKLVTAQDNVRNIYKKWSSNSPHPETPAYGKWKAVHLKLGTLDLEKATPDEVNAVILTEYPGQRYVDGQAGGKLVDLDHVRPWCNFCQQHADVVAEISGGGGDELGICQECSKKFAELFNNSLKS